MFPLLTYAPGLERSDNILFPNMTKRLDEKIFSPTKRQVTAEGNGYFEGFEQTYFCEENTNDRKTWTKCIELKFK